MTGLPSVNKTMDRWYREIARTTTEKGARFQLYGEHLAPAVPPVVSDDLIVMRRLRPVSDERIQIQGLVPEDVHEPRAEEYTAFLAYVILKNWKNNV